ncbi:MAG: hypothetical protein CLLPBCKN_006803 [Chroococcidiopsis cubana SAG 39.79]|uniref:Tail assembly chaperone n=2 Tax=Chroococcidiopsis TaxID=54298 RepID=A0AB37U8T4_9CYAN|nr:hypothetical protein [Chroococcidiopsis cubana]MDZ4877368.1 hypothetical protein [Chroococcidiopsis cubana SAG 39.79]RUS97431.1 hypothetical protein DSM107010_70050 [Chroococcidiopsis cubana SAG 39.79]
MNMPFNIRQLDRLSYDDVEPILDNYISGAIEQFVNSPEGEAHLKNYPEGGGWIGTFIEMGYNYGETTLPKMTKGNVQTLMEYTLPRKVTIFDPAEAEDAIPELVAFWQFLQREYNLRSAKAIVKYLESLASQFPNMMSDPSRGGIAKAFMMMGDQAGFDMTAPEGIQAFQQQYNASLKSAPPDLTTNALKNLIQGGLALPDSERSTPSPSIPKGMGMQKAPPAKKTPRKRTSRKKK